MLRKPLLLCLLTLLCLGSLTACGGTAAQEMQSIQVFAMDTVMGLRACGGETEAADERERMIATLMFRISNVDLDQLDAFAQILVDYNQKVNLTAITDPEGIEDKHFLDSLLFASQPEVAGRMVDVGAGAGFPGIVTTILPLQEA